MAKRNKGCCKNGFKRVHKSKYKFTIWPKLPQNASKSPNLSKSVWMHCSNCSHVFQTVTYNICFACKFTKLLMNLIFLVFLQSLKKNKAVTVINQDCFYNVMAWGEPALSTSEDAGWREHVSHILWGSHSIKKRMKCCWRKVFSWGVHSYKTYNSSDEDEVEKSLLLLAIIYSKIISKLFIFTEFSCLL